MEWEVINTGKLCVYRNKNEKATFVLNGHKICTCHAHWVRNGDILEVDGKTYEGAGTDNQSNHIKGFDHGHIFKKETIKENIIAGCPGCMDSSGIIEGHAYCHYPPAEWQKLWDEGEADVSLDGSTWHIFRKNTNQCNEEEVISVESS